MNLSFDFTNLLLTEQWVTELVDDGETVDMVFLDFAKAFYSVNHRMLCVKRRVYGINSTVVDWVQAFLSNRHFRVRVNIQMSDSRSAGSGIPQGSVLRPTLFLLFVNDLPDVLEGRMLTSTSSNKIFERPGVGQKSGHSQSTPINVFTSQLVNNLLFHSRCMMMHRSALQKAHGISEFS